MALLEGFLALAAIGTLLSILLRFLYEYRRQSDRSVSTMVVEVTQPSGQVERRTINPEEPESIHELLRLIREVSVDGADRPTAQRHPV